MDNDSLLRQKLRDAYKTARFDWRYRRFSVQSAEEGNRLIRAALTAPGPWFAARCGATEMRCMAEYLAKKGFSQRIRTEVRTLSGVFPTDDDTLTRFCALYQQAARQADLLALWDVGAEKAVAAGCTHAAFTRLRALEPYYHDDPWSAALAGQRVLVVHPFADTIQAQYQKRERLFADPRVLPAFASLTVLPAVQGLAGRDTGYDSWFAALEDMQQKMDAIEYDVALIGAGAYGLPLAAHAAATGRKAVQMSGATQLLFGIKGRRWDAHPIISGLYNEAWVRPAPAEQVQGQEKVEGGSYW